MPSTSMMHGITQTMEKLKLSFADAFAFLQATKKILLVDKLYYFYLNYEHLFGLSEAERRLLVHVWQTIDHVGTLENKMPRIFWDMKNCVLFDFVKLEMKEYLTEIPEEASVLLTYGTQYGSPILDLQSSGQVFKYAAVLGFSLHSHAIADRGFLYTLKDGKYHRIPSVPLPTKKWAEWATKVTGKPGGEWWLQGMFLLTEVEYFTYEEAQKFMDESWNT